MTEPNSKDNREALEDLTPEEIPEDNGPDLDNGEEDLGIIAEKLRNIYARITRGVEEYKRVFFQSQQWQILQQTFPGITEEQAISISFMVDDIIDYLPEIREAIEKREKKTGRPITASDLFAGIEYVNEEKDRPGPCLLEDFLEEAQDLRQTRIPSRKAGRKKRQPYNDPVKLKEAEYVTMLNSNLTNGLQRLTLRDFEPTKSGTKAYYTDPKGQKYAVDQFNKMLGNLDVSAKKIFDLAMGYLTTQNYFRGGISSIEPTVLIPFIDYGEKNNCVLTPRVMETPEEQEKEDKRVNERKKDLRKKLRRDLTDLSNIHGAAEKTTGDKSGEYRFLRFISSHGIENDIIKINFDIDFARKIIRSGFLMQYPTILLTIDNRKPNTYAIGRKLALHNSIDNNFFQGTDCTLSVKTLLGEAPEIPTIEELADRGQRNWKDKIKRPLESSLNELITLYPLITKWEYRDAAGARYNAEEAQALSWDEYKRLMIDWTMKEQPPGQAERRAKRLEEKAKALETNSNADRKKGKKRGRPRKKQ